MAPETQSSSHAGAAAASLPAYFLSLTVENVRCFGPEQTLYLSGSEGGPARWTVILGENGLGKSTLLQCLALISAAAFEAPFHDEITMVRSPADGGERWMQDSDKKIPRLKRTEMALKAELAFGAKLDNATRYVKEWIVAEWQKYSNEMLMKFQHASDEDKLRNFICYGYGSNREINPLRSRDDYHKATCGSLFFHYHGLVDPEFWLLDADHMSRIDSPMKHRLERYVSQIKQVLIAVLPDVKDLRVATPHTVGASPSIEALTSDGWIPLRHLGSGYKGHLAWLVDFARRLFERYPDSDDPLAEPAVVLIDEIDLHMHPRWQREIIGYLTERLPNTQFIVTAHSPLIVQAAEDANLVLLRREGDHVVIDNDPVRLRNWRVDQILTSDLFGLESARPPQIEGLLKERRALLSKGRLTANDRRRIQALEAEIGDLPAGESVEDSRAMEIIRRAAAKLQGEGGA